jgi:hypothetical protein
MGYDVYTKAYANAIDNGEYDEVKRLRKQFEESPTGRQELDREEDWELYHKYTAMEDELNEKYAHFRCSNLTGLLDVEFPAEFDRGDAVGWLAKARGRFHRPVTLRNGLGEECDGWADDNDNFVSEDSMEHLERLVELNCNFYVA